MEKIEFTQIHKVIIDFLEEEDNTELKIIGSWYFRFLKSDEEKLSLNLPLYSQELLRLAFDYIRAFTVVFNLLKESELTEFNGTCLFDIFNQSSKTTMNELTLDYLKQKDNLTLWGEGTFTKLGAFIPVFEKEKISQFNKPETIRNTFTLFKSIRNSGIIDFPIKIKLREKSISFNNIDDISDDLISEKLLLVENTLDDDSAMEIEDQLINQELHNSLIIKYPYSKKPHPYLIDTAKKKFNLIFNKRFVHKDILENDIFLLKDEANLKFNIEYNVINSNHSKKLYDLLKYFKEQWVRLELNKFTTPFPKYWLLFLNPSLTKEQWLDRFKTDFPAVAEKPIIKTVENIIDEVIGLKWIEKLIKDSTKILFPQLKSNRKKRLEFVFNNFKNHVHLINSNVEFIDSMDFDISENILILDSFNIIDLINLSQGNTSHRINVVVPDFLYFGYQPWIKYHLYDYHFSAILMGLREVLDDNYKTNKEELDKISKEIIRGVKLDLKNYRSKYKEEKEAEIEAENSGVEDLEYTNYEEIEVYNSEVEYDNKVAIINGDIKLPLNEKVLLQKDSLFYVKAGTLIVGDYILRNSDITELYKSNDLYDKLVNIPHHVFLYQQQLFQKDNIYRILKSKGISYQHQNYFDKTYVLEFVNQQTFRIPRRKNDWSIICELLNINHSDQQLSFIAYYGRSKQNELKQMYKIILELLIANNWVGTIEDSLILNSVSEIVNQYNDIFNASDATEISEVSESIISTIFNQLKLTEVKTIENE